MASDVLVFVALPLAGFAVMGIGALIDPLRIVKIFGTTSLSTDGRNEVRAVYGGYGIAMAVALAIAARSDALRDGILVAVVLALVGMAVGRVISGLVDRACGRMPMLFAVIELAFAALLAGAVFT